eukprot:scaffold57284_cov63-Phaeocystis_antarctica.AAC.1
MGALGHAVTRLVPRPRGEQAVLATLSHSGPTNELDAFIGFSALRTAARASGPRAGPSPRLRARVVAILRRDAS